MLLASHTAGRLHHAGNGLQMIALGKRHLVIIRMVFKNDDMMLPFQANFLLPLIVGGAAELIGGAEGWISGWFDVLFPVCKP